MQEEKLTFKQISDMFSVGYYELMIKQQKSLINGVRNQMKNATEEEKRELQKDIKTYEENIKKYKACIQEIKSAISTINQSVKLLRSYAKEQVLFAAMNEALNRCFRRYEEKDGTRVRIQSDTYDVLHERKFFKKLDTKYERVLNKDRKSVEKKTEKISKDLYKKLKTAQQLKMVVKESDDIVVSQSVGNRYIYSDNIRDYMTLSSSLSRNGISVDGLASKIYDESRKDYNSRKFETLEPLGVDVHRINEAIALYDGEYRHVDEYGEIYDSLKHLYSKYRVQARFMDFREILNKFKTTSDLSVEIQALGMIISAFKTTAIGDSAYCMEVRNVLAKQKTKYDSLKKECIELMEQSGLKEYISDEKRVVELVSLTSQLRYKISRAEASEGFIEELEQNRIAYDQYYSELINLLLVHPEFNLPEYGIDLSKYMDDVKEEVQKDESQEVVTTIQVDKEELLKDLGIKEEPKELIPTIQVGKDELLNDLGVTEKTDNEFTLRDEEIVSTELPRELAPVRSLLYTKYMQEKVNDTELGKKEFSEYLQIVAPELHDLIKIEMLREKRAANVFKRYVIYLASLEDKSQAMKFSQFAHLNFGLLEQDIPFDYTDDEVAKRTM